MNLETGVSVNSGDTTLAAVEIRLLDELYFENEMRLEKNRREKNPDLEDKSLPKQWTPDKTRPSTWLPNGCCYLAFKTFGHLAGIDKVHVSFMMPLEGKGTGNTGSQETAEKGKLGGRKQSRQEAQDAKTESWRVKAQREKDEAMKEHREHTLVKEESLHALAMGSQMQANTMKRRALTDTHLVLLPDLDPPLSVHFSLEYPKFWHIPCRFAFHQGRRN